MLTTYERFFCQGLDTRIPALAEAERLYRTEGAEAAEAAFARFVRDTLRPEAVLSGEYHARENNWSSPGDDDLAAAERILTGELRSCGTPYKFPDTAHVDWEFNATPDGYAEWTWQLSRHHEWRCLGYCYRQTGDERFAKAFVELLMSWCDQAECPADAPFYHTKCWRTIEAGIRMTLNWHYAFHACLRSPHITDRVISTFFRSVCDHGYRLRNFRSGGGNWRAMEMAGLAHIAMLYPFLREASEWGQYAFSELEAELDRQIYADGFQFELTTNYHDVVTLNYHRVLDTAHSIGYPVPRALTDKLLRLFELDIHIVCPDGLYPDLSDGSRSPLRYWCGIGQRYFPDHAAIRYFATDGKEGAPPPYTSVALPYSGLAFMRTGWGKDDLWCFMDGGDFGRGHQHEDKLNVLLFAYGKELLPDTGNYAYDASEMRRFVLDTRSHNCALVDDLGQNRRGRYSWRSEPLDSYAGMTWHFSPGVDSVEAVYDQGYGPDFLNVTHRRKLILFKRGYEGSAPFALVIDRFVSGDGLPHTYQPSWQLGFEPYTDDGMTYNADFGDGISLRILATQPHGLVTGQTSPLFLGWRKCAVKGDCADRTADHAPAPCLRFALEGETARLVTALCPRNGTEKTVAALRASKDPEDTRITVIFTDGTQAELDETDYPCSDTSPDKLYDSGETPC